MSDKAINNHGQHEYCTRSGSFVKLERGSSCAAYSPKNPKAYRNCFNCVHRAPIDPETGKPSESSIALSELSLSSVDLVATAYKRWF